LDAIASNGDVQIEFYNETLPTWINTLTGTSTSTVTLGNYPATFTTTTSSQPYWQNIGTSVNYSPTMDSNLRSTAFFSNSSFETGRIESGEKSNQSLINNSNFNFDWFTFHKVDWKILPHSQKPVEVSDLKKYCHGCGSKIKKSTYKFCPNCGTKLD